MYAIIGSGYGSCLCGRQRRARSLAARGTARVPGVALAADNAAGALSPEPSLAQARLGVVIAQPAVIGQPSRRRRRYQRSHLRLQLLLLLIELLAEPLVSLHGLLDHTLLYLLMVESPVLDGTIALDPRRRVHYCRAGIGLLPRLGVAEPTVLGAAAAAAALEAPRRSRQRARRQTAGPAGRRLALLHALALRRSALLLQQHHLLRTAVREARDDGALEARRCNGQLHYRALLRGLLQQAALARGRRGGRAVYTRQ